MTGDLRRRLEGFGTAERIAEVPVSEHAIRTWCAAVGETDPLHLDQAAARRAGYRDVLAPHAMLQTWTMPIHDRAADPTLHTRVRAAAGEAGLPAVVATDYEQEYLRPIHPGALLSEMSRVEAVSDPKDTTLGRGRFVTIGFEFSDGDGPVGRMRARTLYFEPATATSSPTRHRSPTPEPTEHGTESLTIPVGRTLVVAASLASNDHEAVHHDHETAWAQGLPDIIMSIVTTAGLLLRFTNTAESPGSCRALRLRLARPTVPGDELVLRGRRSGGVHTVDGDHSRGRHVSAEIRYSTA